MRNRLHLMTMLFGVAVLAAACCPSALAGPLPVPLLVDLDLADRVVIGKVTKIEELGDLGGKRGSSVRWGRATVEVRETLKGEKEAQLSFIVAVWVDPKYGGSSPPRVHKVGDEGIWITSMDDGERIAAHYRGLLDEKRLDEVKAQLKELDSRQWSEESGGLRAWAATTDADGSARPVVVFCVRNSTDKDIWLPVPSTTGLLRASAAAEGAQPRNCDLNRDRPADRSELLVANVLKPGETRYMHPDYSFLDIGRDLASGKYQVTVAMENRAPKGSHYMPKTGSEKVDLWTGKLVAKPVTLTVPEKPAR